MVREEMEVFIHLLCDQCEVIILTLQNNLHKKFCLTFHIIHSLKTHTITQKEPSIMQNKFMVK